MRSHDRRLPRLTVSGSGIAYYRHFYPAVIRVRQVARWIGRHRSAGVRADERVRAVRSRAGRSAPLAGAAGSSRRRSDGGLRLPSPRGAAASARSDRARQERASPPTWCSTAQWRTPPRRCCSSRAGRVRAGDGHQRRRRTAGHARGLRHAADRSASASLNAGDFTLRIGAGSDRASNRIRPPRTSTCRSSRSSSRPLLTDREPAVDGRAGRAVAVIEEAIYAVTPPGSLKRSGRRAARPALSGAAAAQTPQAPPGPPVTNPRPADFGPNAPPTTYFTDPDV